MSIVKIHFKDEKRAKEFVSWMCEAGEQWWWQHCEDAGIEGSNDRFEYHTPQNKEYPINDERRYKDSKFGGEDGLTISIATEE